jgi:TonB family protein
MHRLGMATVATVIVLVAACGGGTKESGGKTTTVTKEKAPEPEVQSPDQGIPPEKLDEVQSIFRRKTTQATGCYNSALDALEVGKRKGHQGHVTISLTLGTDGKPTHVKVEKSTLDLPKFNDCLVEQVKGWAFPELPQQSFFNWTFSFKPAY